MQFGKQDMSNSVYHDPKTPGITKGHLDMINKCPYTYYSWLNGLTPKEQTPAMAFGSLVHTAVLEPEKMDQFFADTEFVKLGIRSTKAYKEAAQYWAACNPKKTLIKAEDEKTVKRIIQAIKENDLATSLFTGGEAETVWVWTDEDTGIVCKCKPDYFKLIDGRPHIIDLKTIDNARGFERSSGNFRYHVQDAHYSDGIFKSIGEYPVFLFVVVEKDEPFGIRICEFDPVSKDFGIKARENDLKTLRKCLDTNVFPKYETKTWGVPEIESVKIPEWVFYNAEFER